MNRPLSWFGFWVGTCDHIKTKRLHRALGHERGGLYWVLKLWELAAEYAPADGVLEGRFLVDELEPELGWDGAPGRLLDAYMSPSIRLLDASPLRVHQWEEWQPFATRAVRMGKRAQERAEDDADEADDAKPSPYFLRWWDLVPQGMKAGVNPAYRAWRKHGLDDPGAAGEVARAEVYSTFRAQLQHENWRRHFTDKGTALSYMRKKDWLYWKAAEEPRAPAPPPAAPPDLVVAEQQCRADWESLESSKGRTWPGYTSALHEVLEAARKGAN